MAHKKTRIARITADLDEIPPLFESLEKIAYRAQILVGAIAVSILALLGAIDLIVRVLRVH